MSLFTHPKLTNDFKRELDLVRDADPAVRLRAKPAFSCLSKIDGGAPLLFKALHRCAPLIAVPGVQHKPGIWVSPPPTSIGDTVGIVIGQDGKGNLRCCASNTMAQPAVPKAASRPAGFFEAYDALRSTAAQAGLLHDTISRVAASLDQMDLVNRLAAEGQRYRTMPAYLVVWPPAGEPLFFATTLVVEGLPQTNAKLAFAGRVQP